MNEPDHIGEYVARIDSDSMGENPLTKYHRVESHVADRYVTHCGREMGYVPGTVLIFAIVPPEGQRCARD